jgi:Ca2+-binding RTX toxin-like protein
MFDYQQGSSGRFASLRSSDEESGSEFWNGPWMTGPEAPSGYSFDPFAIFSEGAASPLAIKAAFSAEPALFTVTEPQQYLAADQRGGFGPNGLTSYTVEEAAAQITRAGYSWNGYGVTGTPAVVTYSFRASTPDFVPNGAGNFSRFNANQITQAELALRSWSDVANITFVRVNASGYSDDGQVIFSNYNSGAEDSAGFAYYPGSWVGGDIWINGTLDYNLDPRNLNYGRLVLTHEIGHAIGLQHPGDYNGSSGYGPTYYEDTMQYSIMSYWSETETGADYHGHYTAAPLLDDIAAAQRLYGVNTSARVGNTVYGFNSNAGRDYYSATSSSDALIFAVWDAGGTDTLDFSRYSNNQLIDLRAGYFSDVGGLVGNVAIAIGAVIENGFGGSGSDLIIGNAVGNVLRGNGGADLIYGLDGDDTLVAGPGVGQGPGPVVLSEHEARASLETAYELEWMSLAENGNIESSTVIPHATVHATSTGTLEWYKVTVGQQGSLIIDIDGASFDTVVTLFDSAGNQVGRNDDHGGDSGSPSSLDSLLRYEVFAPGVYYVQVSAYPGSATPPAGSYTLHISVPGGTVGGGNVVGSVLEGGAGSDILISGADADTLNGGAGADLASYAASASAVSVRLVSGAQDTGGGGRDTLIGIEGLIGSRFADTLVGNSGANVLEGAGGDDVLNGGGGRDIASYSSAAGAVAVSLSILTQQDTRGAGRDTLTGIESLRGSRYADTLTGDAAANDLDGGAGADTMTGGAGNDIYVVDNAGDRVVETSATGGVDTVNSSVTVALGTNVENLVLTGTAAINGTGNTLANALVGNSGANVLNGGTGADTMTGGAGNDTYMVDSAGDRVVETSASGGADTVNSSITFTLGANVENLVLSGTAALNGTGNTLGNSIAGNSAANALNGGAGADRMTGGAGNDTYIVDNVGDRAVETSATGGVDTVNSTVSFTLGTNVETLVLTGTAAINGTGNTLANAITGNSAANVLNGGAGADTMTGGAGHDTYVVDVAGDRVVETSATGGVDTVHSSISLALGANVENLVLTGTAALNGTGNTLANAITGNSAANILNGGAGADTMSGAAGNDTYLVDNAGDRVVETSASGGADRVNSSVTFTLGANVEALVLTGTAAINGTGNTLANSIVGNSAANVLNGGAGADTMTGGAGNDSYVVDSAGDRVIETSATGGLDTVNSSVTFTLGTNVEILVLTGTTAINGTGNTLANAITGNSAANILNGAAGADTMTGGAGNDTYVVDNARDRAVETSASGGVDTVHSAVSFTLGANLENLVLTGTAALNGTGNTLANSITGNSAANVLNGGAGADMMSGGAGNDTYVVDSAGDRVVETSASGGADRVNSSVTFTLGTNVETLVLTGTAAINGIGNTLANSIVGNSAANVLSGGIGADTMTGGAGNDTYVVDNVGDRAVETSATGGLDTVNSSVTFTLGANVENLVLTGTAAINGTGNTLANAITGNSAANLLNGGAGADTMTGGAGSDTYIVDNVADVVVESSSSGGYDRVNSSVSYALGANVESLVLTGTAAVNGTGNGLANSITGNSAANVIDGGAGADTMTGGTGDDTYIVDHVADAVVESSSLDGGYDRVNSSVTYALAANVEELVLTGTAAVNGTGNGLANSITGNSAANIINGGAGADTMVGGAGDDTYFVDDAADGVVESDLIDGHDRVNSSVSYALGVNIEDLVLTGSAGVDGTGNELDNSITGNSAVNIIDGGAGADTLAGGLGDDTLTGGAGADSFYFDTALSDTGNTDTILDYTVGEDSIVLSRNVFSTIDAAGSLSASAFYIGTAAQTADHRIIYDDQSGDVFFDADGTGSVAAILFANVAANTALTNMDFIAV